MNRLRMRTRDRIGFTLEEACAVAHGRILKSTHQTLARFDSCGLQQATPADLRYSTKMCQLCMAFRYFGRAASFDSKGSRENVDCLISLEDQTGLSYGH
jgi:CRISPR/Cas system type I-B associated protein Csh2 (Cas7 group RAMP superfamily)